MYNISIKFRKFLSNLWQLWETSYAKVAKITFFYFFCKTSHNVLSIRGTHFSFQWQFFYRKLIEKMKKGSIKGCFKSMSCLNQWSQRRKRLWYRFAWSAALNLQLLCLVQIIIAKAIWGLEMGQSSRVLNLLLLPQFWSHSLGTSTIRQPVSWCIWWGQPKNFFFVFEDFGWNSGFCHTNLATNPKLRIFEQIFFWAVVDILSYIMAELTDS
jgi:hypothetical protein